VNVRDFLHAVYYALSAELSKRHQKHQWRIRFGYLQVYFGDPTIHYEAWVQRRNQRIELGLHFEGERETNYRWAELLAPPAALQQVLARRSLDVHYCVCLAPALLL
jgi:hypothetical protein